MRNFIVFRLLSGLVILIGVSVICFILITFAPGDYSVGASVESGSVASGERLYVSDRLGLNMPVYARYFIWLGMIIRGDLGKSYVDGKGVREKIAAALPYTFALGSAAMALSLSLSIFLGLSSAYFKASLPARFCSAFFYVLSSIPDFWLALILIYFFAVINKWLPVSGAMDMRQYLLSGSAFSFSDRFAHLILPAVTLGLGNSMVTDMQRHVCVEAEEIISADFICAARARGLRERSIALKHVLKNAAAPILSVMFYKIPYLLGGTVVVEEIFAWPGMGRLAINSIVNRDYPVAMGVTLTVTVFVVLAGILSDVLLAFFDPRIRFIAEENM